MKKYERINRKFESLFFPRIKKPIQAKIDGLIKVLESNGSGRAYIETQLINPELANEVRRIYQVVGVRHANEMTRGLRREPKVEKKGFGFSEEWVKFIQEYLGVHFLERITFSVTSTLRDHLLLIMNRSIAEGWGVDKTVRALRNDTFSDFQAARIVRTEVNTAANVGVIASGSTYDYEMQKEWVSVHDNRTRGVDPKDHANHVALDKTTIDFDDVFIDSRNGDRLRHPGDPLASAGSIINCRCNLTLKPKRDSTGRLIPKRKTTSVIYPNQIRRGQTILI